MASVTGTITFACVLALASVAGTACGSSDEFAEPLPDVQVTPLAGGDAMSLSDIEGPAVINLWATTCVPCLTEIPAFESVHRSRGRTIRFVGLNIGESAEQAAPFVESVGATYDQFLDELGHATTALEASAMPTTIVVDAGGNIATRHIGQMNVADLNSAIDDALAD
jgi:cytochrome c biogenesis protein CcmG/thiol:disulfide interchange protein DsbE